MKSLEEQEQEIKELTKKLEEINVTEHRVTNNEPQLQIDNPIKEDNATEEANKSKKQASDLFRDSFTGMNAYHLSFQMDTIGLHYQFRNIKNEQHKFYLETPSATPEFKLNDLEDYPLWARGLKLFCRQWNLDDITMEENENKSYPETKEILKLVIVRSLGKRFTWYRTSEKSAYQIFRGLKDTVMFTYRREAKDEMWRTTSVDKFCSDTLELQEMFHRMFLLKIYTHDESSGFTLTNEFMNEKIKGTLDRRLKERLRYDIKELALRQNISVERIHPNDYVKCVVTIIQEIKQSNEIFNEPKIKCSHCSSVLHHPKNCRVKSKSHSSNDRSQLNHNNYIPSAFASTNNYAGKKTTHGWY